mmetsp:Transcript_23825/g.48642  ORF Transcript_23825/g.48642 Transcript_23825/m.48642 type:complete len:234 (+) Transcript_23825:2975-3676(+)
MNLNLTHGAIMLLPIMAQKSKLQIPRPRRLLQLEGLLPALRFGLVHAQIGPILGGRSGVFLTGQYLKFPNVTGIAFVIGEFDLLDEDVLGEADDDVEFLVLTGGYGVPVYVAREEVGGAFEGGRFFEDLGAGEFGGVVYQEFFAGAIVFFFVVFVFGGDGFVSGVVVIVVVVFILICGWRCGYVSSGRRKIIIGSLICWRVRLVVGGSRRDCVCINIVGAEVARRGGFRFLRG